MCTFCIVLLKLANSLIINLCSLVGSCFRTLAVILVSGQNKTHYPTLKSSTSYALSVVQIILELLILTYLFAPT